MYRSCSSCAGEQSSCGLIHPPLRFEATPDHNACHRLRQHRLALHTHPYCLHTACCLNLETPHQPAPLCSLNHFTLTGGLWEFPSQPVEGQAQGRVCHTPQGRARPAQPVCRDRGPRHAAGDGERQQRHARSGRGVCSGRACGHPADRCAGGPVCRLVCVFFRVGRTTSIML
jgi:hypothetical protein